MKNLPLPTNLPWELQLVFWVLIVLVVALIGLAIWFLKRHITQQDTQFKKVEDKLSGQTKELEQIKTDILGASKKIVEESEAIKKSSLEFQGKVAEEVMTIRKEMVHIEKTVERTKLKATELENKIDKNIVAVQRLNTGIEQINERVEAHHKSLSASARIAKKHQDEIDTIKTTVRKISENVFVIGEKKIKKPNGHDDGNDS